MVPISLFRPTILGNIKTPAVILPIDKYGEPLVVVGKDGDATAAFIGANHQFETLPADGNKHFKGMVIEELEIEVDPSSVYSLDGHYPIFGSVLRSPWGFEFVGRSKDQHGFPETRRVVVEGQAADPQERPMIGFTRWRLVKRDGDRILFEQAIEGSGSEH